MKNLLTINPKKETKKIIGFLKQTFRKQKIEKAVIGLSGGIDSALAFTLLIKALKPKQIIALYLPYSMPFFKNKDGNYQNIKKLLKKNRFSEKNFYVIPISGPTKKILDKIKTASLTLWQKLIYGANECFTCPNTSTTVKIRFGNIMARLRMIFLFDTAKKNQALVCGTENKSERLLGYYTRFGDSASDLEPISHLYKTQVLQLAKYLKIPKKIITTKPSAGLWENQTDEGEFGFTYAEADQVLYLTHDRGQDINIVKKNFPNAEKIFKRFLDNQFKLKTPYKLT